MSDQEEKNNGINNSKRRIVSISSCHRASDGSYIFVGRRRLHGSVRDTKKKLSGYVDTLHLHIMHDGSGSLVGCICK